ncbi:MAG: 30S ribosomal protein S20 [Candidatus Dependentiae bacterium]|nr:30S ribosomal protein S20 [Candidatus Dependentiae bacterium]
MANTKSAKKQAIQSEKRRQINLSRKSAVKTAVKKLLTEIASNDITKAQATLKDVEAKLARAKGKNVIHKNTAARKISRLAKRVSAAQKNAGAKASK